MACTDTNAYGMDDRFVETIDSSHRTSVSSTYKQYVFDERPTEHITPTHQGRDKVDQ